MLFVSYSHFTSPYILFIYFLTSYPFDLFKFVISQSGRSVKKLPLSWKKMCFVIILILTLRSLNWYKTSSALPNPGAVIVDQ